MLAEERFSRILSIIEAEGSATIQELMTALDASESTVRRDLITMDENGLLTKVHGGAIARRPSVSTHDEDVRNRKTMNAEQKNAIAKYAASLIRPDDFVYLDAGTSTEAMIPFIKETQAVFVTNAISHAKLLAEKGCRVYLLGGEFSYKNGVIGIDIGLGGIGIAGGEGMPHLMRQCTIRIRLSTARTHPHHAYSLVSPTESGCLIIIVHPDYHLITT